jgi:hypothetical protein
MTKPLRPQRHEPPPGWDAETFERVTDALAAALVASYRRQNDHAPEECGSRRLPWQAEAS